MLPAIVIAIKCSIYPYRATMLDTQLKDWVYPASAWKDAALMRYRVTHIAYNLIEKYSISATRVEIHICYAHTEMQRKCHKSKDTCYAHTEIQCKCHTSKDTCYAHTEISSVNPTRVKIHVMLIQKYSVNAASVKIHVLCSYSYTLVHTVQDCSRLFRAKIGLRSHLRTHHA